LKKHLQALSPPVLFGCGNRRLLDQGGLAVIGSRHATPEDLLFTSRLGSQAAAQGWSIISGGARGVDENAMIGALAQEGTVVGVLADGLLRAATSARFRPGLMNGNLVLISPFNPEAGFEVGNAMGRNKYIYCLADAAVVIAADREKGGTWSGAVENLKQGWIPLWVKAHADLQSGNAELVRRGARWLPEALGELAALRDREAPLVPEPVLDQVAESAPPRLSREVPAEPAPTTVENALDRLSFYELFLRRLQTLAANAPATDEELLEQLDIGKPQLQAWLKRAITEGQVKKINKPVRYQWQVRRPAQDSFFAHS
jgi:predicted Rossmann fold nucleotide-binding protein DprA/Smf involved in DNA uptake